MREIEATVRKDCTRTFSQLLFFRSAVIQDMIVRLLLVFTLEHPDLGYKQGLTDLVAILLLCVYCDRDRGSDLSDLSSDASSKASGDGGDANNPSSSAEGDGDAADPFALQQHTLDVLDAHLRFQPQLHQKQNALFARAASAEQRALVAALGGLTATAAVEHDCYLLLAALIRPLRGCYSAQFEASPEGLEQRMQRVMALVAERRPAVPDTFAVAARGRPEA